MNTVTYGIAELVSIIPDAVIDDISVLSDAITLKSYPTVYKELRRLKEPLHPGAAFALLCEALQNGLTLRAIRAILDRSPPLPELLSAGFVSDILLCNMGLVEYAAWLDRADVLALFLERGVSPNRSAGLDISPLEAALENESLGAMELLMEQPELDTSWTPKLLEEWASMMGMGAGEELFLQTMAPRFTGWEAGSGLPLPIPEPMTAQIIVRVHNWPVLERFCHERPVSPEDGALALEAAASDKGLYTDGACAACAGAVALISESCPDLLREEAACRSLLRCFFRLGPAAHDILRPWVESLGSRSIAMEEADWCSLAYAALPPLWQRLLPNGPILVLDRWSDVFDSWLWCCGDFTGIPSFSGSSLRQPEVLRSILDACPVRGEGRRGELSPVARTVLRWGDAPLIESFFRPGGLLATEDPDALTDYLMQDGDVPRTNRAAALACIRREESYDL